jgi:transcriptional regulator with XRE-family HTH domain
MSQKNLGEAIGLTFQQVQKYERGANRVSAGLLWRLGRVLDVSVLFFFEDIARGAPQQPAVADDQIMMRCETLDLVRAHYRITDPKLRQVLLDIATAIAQVTNH